MLASNVRDAVVNVPTQTNTEKNCKFPRNISIEILVNQLLEIIFIITECFDGQNLVGQQHSKTLKREKYFHLNNSEN